MEDAPPISNWKLLAKQKTQTYWVNLIVNRCGSYTSLKYLDTTHYKPVVVHPIVKTIGHTSLDIRRGKIIMKLVTGTYSLRSNRVQFNQYAVDKTCLLCQGDIETRQHFVAECEYLAPHRIYYKQKITDILPYSMPQDPELLVRMVLNPYSVYPDMDATALLDASREGRRLLYSLHIERQNAMIKLPKNSKDRPKR
jgi:hypothetical protein